MNLDPLILALDCATTGCSVGVWRSGKVLACESLEMNRGQAEVLVPMIDRQLSKANVEASALSAIAVTNGPGSFTGLRIGLATARGLALALNIKCLGITTLQAVVQGVTGQERFGKIILAVVESKRVDIFVQIFDAKLRPLTQPQAVNGKSLTLLCKPYANILAVGDGAVRAQKMLADNGRSVNLSTAPALPEPVHIATLAAARFDGTANVPPQPLYLRPPDAKLPKAQGRART